MTVKELKQRLENVPENAVVLLYDGLDEGDVFCTTTAYTKKDNYCGYCKGDSFVDDDCCEDVFVLAGWGTVYSYLEDSDNECLWEIIDSPEAEKEREEAQKKEEAKRIEYAKKREEAKREFEENRKKRYCLNFESKRGLNEINCDSIEEAMEILRNTTYREFVIYDRVESKVAYSG